MRFFERIIKTDSHAAVLLIRLMVGAVFLSEGMQKFLFSEEVGSGRFRKIGIPNPDMTAPLVGTFEIICGILILLGLLTRLAAIPLIIIMLAAIFSTKIPILLGYEFWGFSLRKVSYYGLWGMAHEARTDWAMLLGSLFLLIVGAGKLSIDAYLTRHRTSNEEND